MPTAPVLQPTLPPPPSTPIIRKKPAIGWSPASPSAADRVDRITWADEHPTGVLYRVRFYQVDGYEEHEKLLAHQAIKARVILRQNGRLIDLDEDGENIVQKMKKINSQNNVKGHQHSTATTKCAEIPWSLAPIDLPEKEMYSSCYDDDENQSNDINADETQPQTRIIPLDFVPQPLTSGDNNSDIDVDAQIHTEIEKVDDDQDHTDIPSTAVATPVSADNDVESEKEMNKKPFIFDYSDGYEPVSPGELEIIDSDLSSSVSIDVDEVVASEPLEAEASEQTASTTTTEEQLQETPAILVPDAPTPSEIIIDQVALESESPSFDVYVDATATKVENECKRGKKSQSESSENRKQHHRQHQHQRQHRNHHHANNSVKRSRTNENSEAFRRFKPTCSPFETRNSNNNHHKRHVFNYYERTCHQTASSAHYVKRNVKVRTASSLSSSPQKAENEVQNSTRGQFSESTNAINTTSISSNDSTLATRIQFSTETDNTSTNYWY